MKVRFSLFVVLIFSLGFSYYILKPEKANLKELGERSPAGIDESANGIYLSLPPFLRNKMKEYLVMVGIYSYQDTETSCDKEGCVGSGVLSVSGENSGLRAYNTILLAQNSCFKALVQSFYFDLAKIDLKSVMDRSSFESHTEVNSLAETTKNTNVPSGWLWNFALKKAKGDANLAMSLIGICGHDNMSQLQTEGTVCSFQNGDVSCQEVERQRLIYNADKQKELLKYQSAYLKKVLELWKPKTVAQKNAKEFSETEEYRRETMTDCPGLLSPMFTQGSLGERTLLPDDLVNEISKTQAPIEGAKILPGKYYHTIGSAVMACSLVREGMPAILVKKIQSTLVNTYRMTRLCAIHHENREVANVDLQAILNKVSQVRLNKDICVESENTDSETGKIFYSFKDEPICNFIGAFQTLIFDKDTDLEILKNKFQRRIAELNASKLFVEQVSPMDDCQKVQLTKENINKIKEVAESSTNCSGISSADCDRAKNVLKTWWVDFEWSESQQLKGAEFAIQNCKPEPNFTSASELCREKKTREEQVLCEENKKKSGLEGKSCEALQSVKATTGNTKESEGVY